MSLKDRPVLTKVLSGLVVAAIVGIATTIVPGGWFGVFGWIGHALSRVGHGLSAAWSCLVGALQLAVPVWYILLGLLCVAGLSAGWWTLRRRKEHPNAPPALEPPRLLPLEFAGLRWQEHDGKLVPCCPKCDLEIRPRHAHAGISPEFTRGPVHYDCDHCGPVCADPRTHHDLLDLLAREIQREKRARTNSAISHY